MNLDMMYEATRLTGDEKYAKIADSQARISATTHIRPDGTTYHVIDFNPKTGKVQKSFTAQGMSHDVSWQNVRFANEQALPMRAVGRAVKLGASTVTLSAVRPLRLSAFPDLLLRLPWLPCVELTFSTPLRNARLHRHLPPTQRHLPLQTPLHRCAPLGL
jgi:hypothetical protein